MKPRRALPLYARILLAVLVGSLLGLLWPGPARVLGDLGMLVIKLLKALATPLILFAVLDSFLRTRIPAKRGGQLVLISLLNAAVATALGLLVAHALHGGEHWRGQMRQVAASAMAPAQAGVPMAGAERPTLDPIKNIGSFVPESLIEPFAKNNVITVVLLAVLVGVAMRKIKDRSGIHDPPPEGEVAAQRPEGGTQVGTGDPGEIRVVESAVHVGLQVFTRLLEWLIDLVPVAVFGVIASVVSRSGLQIFRSLGIFLGTILLGLLLHAVGYYSLLLFAVARVSPRRFFGAALDAILTALSCGSSLATLPVTLRCLTEKMGVSTESARLAACVGTNLNHDGIILYEASAAVFVAQAFGYSLGVEQQLAIALAAVMAGIGIAGVPEAGLITLPLVLGAAGLPEAAAATAVPLILPVDWIIGRFRAATNVTSDMIVANILERLARTERPETGAWPGPRSPGP